jgi:hypothetical protein
MKLFRDRWNSRQGGQAPLIPETVARVGAALVQDDDRERSEPPARS